MRLYQGDNDEMPNLSTEPATICYQPALYELSYVATWNTAKEYKEKNAEEYKLQKLKGLSLGLRD